MSRLSTIGTHRTTISVYDGFTRIQYHNTQVVKFSDTVIILDSGGYQTATTKTRMNQTANQFDLGYHVYQKNFEWYVDFDGKTYDFEDEMILERQSGY